MGLFVGLSSSTQKYYMWCCNSVSEYTTNRDEGKGYANVIFKNDYIVPPQCQHHVHALKTVTYLV